MAIEETREINVLLLFKMAFKRKKLIAWASLAITLPTVAVAFLLPNRYEVTVVILPPQQKDTVSSALMGALGSAGAVAAVAGSGSSLLKNPNDLQVSFLKSQPVENAMVERFRLQDLYRAKYLSRARKHWEKVTTVDNGLKDGLIRISVTDRDPQRALELATGWVEEYRRLTATLAVTEASQRRLFFEQQLKAARDDLTHAEDNLKQTQQRTGILEIGSQASVMIQQAAGLRAAIASKKAEIESMRQFATDQNPGMIDAQQELRTLQNQLAAMDVSNQESSGDLTALKGSVTQASLDYVRALREVGYRQTLYDLLLRQYEIARVDEAKEGPTVQIVNPGSVPDRPSTPHRAWIILGGAVLGLPLSLLLAIIVEIGATFRRLDSSTRGDGTEGWLMGQRQ